jgi:coenzyme F420 hydrogenase subunit delta
MYRELLSKRVLVLGCGNVLMGDDGFGPAVIKRLEQHHDLPDDVHAEDVGTSIREILFNITLLEERPQHLIILDAVDRPGRNPGDVFEIPVDEIPRKKIADYSFHQFPTTNLLNDIRDACGVRVTIIAAQTTGKLEEVKPGLSEPVKTAVRRAAQHVGELVSCPSSKEQRKTDHICN